MRLINQSHWGVALLVSERLEYVSCVLSRMCTDMDPQNWDWTACACAFIGSALWILSASWPFVWYLEGNGKKLNQKAFNVKTFSTILPTTRVTGPSAPSGLGSVNGVQTHISTFLVLLLWNLPRLRSSASPLWQIGKDSWERRSPRPIRAQLRDAPRW